MKEIEAIIPRGSVQPTVRQLQHLGVQQITVESVQVFRNNVHQVMIHRGCTYEQGFTTESKLRFAVSRSAAAQAETIVADVANR